MWNGIGWYGFIGPTTSTTDMSVIAVPLQKCDFETLDRIKVEYALNWTAISAVI